MSPTPNHDYSTPTEGTKNWHIPLNENFDKLDTDIEVRAPESDKSEFEPKEGAKFEATDSGAIYYGNGKSWVPANRKVDSFEASEVNGWVTPKEPTVQSFINATKRGRYIKLNPRVTYDWDETYIHDPEKDDDLHVDARGAKIDVTADPGIDILTTVYIGNAGKLRWEGGKFIGPGKSNGSSVDPTGVPDYAPAVETGTSAFRVNDALDQRISPGDVRNFRAAVFLRNKEKWTEGCKISGGCTEEKVDYFVLALSGDYLGTSGGGSMRNTEIVRQWGDGRGGKATIYQGGVGFQGGKIIHRENLPSDGHGWFADGNLQGTHIHWESEFGENSTAIEIAGSGRTPPPFIFRDPSGRLEVNRSGNVFTLDGGSAGFQDMEGKKSLYSPYNREAWVAETNRFEAGDASSGFPSDVFRVRDNSGNVWASLGKMGGSGAVISAHRPGDNVHVRNWNDEEYTNIVTAGHRISKKRSIPDNEELSEGESLLYVSDGSTTDKGDLVRAHNNGGEIKTKVISKFSNLS